MYSAIADEPTKPIAWTRGSVSSVSTASLSPLTTLSTPAGRPASMSSSASRIGTDGSRSDGLRMKELPQAIAGEIGIEQSELQSLRQLVCRRLIEKKRSENELIRKKI